MWETKAPREPMTARTDSQDRQDRQDRQHGQHRSSHLSARLAGLVWSAKRARDRGVLGYCTVQAGGTVWVRPAAGFWQCALPSARGARQLRGGRAACHDVGNMGVPAMGI